MSKCTKTITIRKTGKKNGREYKKTYSYSKPCRAKTKTKTANIPFTQITKSYIPQSVRQELGVKILKQAIGVTKDAPTMHEIKRIYDTTPSLKNAVNDEIDNDLEEEVRKYLDTTRPYNMLLRDIPKESFDMAREVIRQKRLERKQMQERLAKAQKKTDKPQLSPYNKKIRKNLSAAIRNSIKNKKKLTIEEIMDIADIFEKSAVPKVLERLYGTSDRKKIINIVRKK